MTNRASAVSSYPEPGYFLLQQADISRPYLRNAHFLSRQNPEEKTPETFRQRDARGIIIQDGCALHSANMSSE